MKYIYLFLLSSLLVSCQGYGTAEVEAFDEKIKSNFAKEIDTYEKSASGVYIKILEEGQGQNIQYGDMIEVKYKGTLLDGTVFDMAKDGVELPLKHLIPAWKEALIGQNEGVKLKLITPPQMGYGGSERPKIPANSVLYFEIELLKAR